MSSSAPKKLYTLHLHTRADNQLFEVYAYKSKKKAQDALNNIQNNPINGMLYTMSIKKAHRHYD